MIERGSINLDNTTTHKTNTCIKCGSTKSLITHHISYIPEITETICRLCHGKEKRHPKSRGLTVLKSYPQRGMLLVPKRILETLGEFIEIEEAPISPVAVIFQYNMPLNIVKGTLEIILKKIQLRIDHEKPG